MESSSDMKKLVVGGAAALTAVAAGYLLYRNTKGPGRQTHIDTDYEGQHNLGKKEAQERSAMIGDVSYQVAVCLRKQTEAKSFFGTVEMEFSVKKSGYLFVDYMGKQINNLTVNGQIIPQECKVLKGHRIQIPWNMLKQDGKNMISMEFESNYVTDCHGMQWFKDEDGEEYLYTNAEPNYGHMWFPCFDQPDLKAGYSLAVVAPADWKVISTCPRDALLDIQGDAAKFRQSCSQFKITSDMLKSFGDDQKTAKLHVFPKSQPISTYLYAICAGPYAEFAPETPEATSSRVPMKLYCRKSMAQYLPPFKEDWFRVTKCAVEFYEVFFSCPYPFGKLDQVFCPDYEMGAMENVGCVTYRDDYIPRGEKFTKVKWENICNTVTHEVSHMWFGNLVTMQWWDDLWLNESFANMISYMCMDQSEGLKDIELAWSIFLDEQFWALRTDQADTSHPIAATCNSTADAEDIFDGISYGKGGSWLHQIVHLIGEPAFREGIKTYFAKYSFKNTVLDQFIAELAAAQRKINPAPFSAGGTFEEWADTWVRVAGCNTFEIEAGTDGDYVITQGLYNIENTPENRYRRQSIIIAAFNDKLEVIETKTVDIQETDIKKSFKFDCGTPAAVFLNQGAHGYGKFMIDEKTMQVFEKVPLKQIQDRLTRKQIYNILFDMVRTCHAAGSRVLSLIANNIQDESAEEILDDLLKGLVPALIKKYVPHGSIGQYNEKLFNACLNMLASGKFEAESTKQLLIESIKSFSSTKEQYTLLASWFTTGKASDFQGKDLGVELTTMHRHKLLKSIYTTGHLDQAFKDGLMAQMEKIDSSDMLSRTKAYCAVAVPTLEAKTMAWNKLFSNKKEDELILSIAIENALGFRQGDQMSLLNQFSEKFFTQIYECVNTKAKSVSQYIWIFLQPNLEATQAEIDRYEKFMKQIEDPGFKKGDCHDRVIKWCKESLCDLKLKKQAREVSAEWEKLNQAKL